ncbi:hypothetical protein [Oleiagrimonas soli]|uniref:Transmembrane protein n=1 Tax=Oleiagrimonas soli TaxID=1543381 RepID=A0A099CZV3_9GAMM|nr:hypothetical protein [Oleiagrimonas soli]KGI79241.1 hypothetical protein LF63_0100185 [Oleiagrimonas soli]MBB6184865.1 hypothetical protein [Oleiagrimonas soli]
MLRFLRNIVLGAVLVYAIAWGLDAIGHWLHAPGNAPRIPHGIGAGFIHLAYLLRLPVQWFTALAHTHALRIGATVAGYTLWGLVIAMMARAQAAQRARRRKAAAASSSEN